MDARQIATAHAAGRAVVGAVLTIAPKAAASGWIGDDAGRDPVAVVVRALGVRDAVLGAGALRAAGDADTARQWVAAGLVCDAVDLGATLLARDKLPAQGAAAVALLAGGSALLGAWLLTALD